MAAPKVPTAPTQDMRNAKADLEAMLDRFGLSSLKEWAWEQIVAGASPQELQVRIYGRPEFDARFPAIAERRKRGLAPLSPEEYVTYEEGAMQAMRAANMPDQFWNRHDDFTQLLVNDVSIDELNSRITQGYLKVAAAPKEIRDQYTRYFGVDGDAALAASFLDPERSVEVLSQQVRAAEFGGVGKRYGFGVSFNTAAEYAKRDYSTAEVDAGMKELDRIEPLLNGTIDEIKGFTLDEGLEGVFGDEKDAFDRRLAGRKAESEGGGSAAVDESGVSGLGEAR